MTLADKAELGYGKTSSGRLCLLPCIKPDQCQSLDVGA